MPHRVTDFLRTSSGNIAQIKKVATSRSRGSSRNNSPYNSEGEMTDLDHAKKHRLSLHFGKSSKETTSPVALSWSIESPPVVFHGSPEESTGALVSGQMFIDVRDEVVEIGGFSAKLRLHTNQKRPFQGHCNDCQHQYTELRSWQLIPHPTVIRRGRHSFPFSILLDGNLPASMDTPIAAVSYEFNAEAYVNRSPNSTTTSCSTVRFDKTIPVKRSLPEHDIPHHSVRVFPPTNIKASAHYSSIIHPTGANTVNLRLDGLVTHNEKTKTMDFWRLKKITWRLEETIKSIAPACDRHTAGTAEDEPEKRGLVRTETRLLGEKHIHDGWKSDYSGADGTVETELEYYPTQYKAHGRELKYACDTKTDAIEVTHALQIELVVSREYAPEGKPQLATQTGTGRILRMHYNVVMTDHAGLGVSWDNEAPPVYQDVPPSPPAYPVDRPVDCPIEYESVESLSMSRRPSQESDALSSVPSSTTQL